VKFKGQGLGFWVLSIKHGPNHTKLLPKASKYYLKFTIKI
jgi:hypothetical protein